MQGLCERRFIITCLPLLPKLNRLVSGILSPNEDNLAPTLQSRGLNGPWSLLSMACVRLSESYVRPDADHGCEESILPRGHKNSDAATHVNHYASSFQTESADDDH